MIWIILLVIIAVIIISFLSSLNKDTAELQLQTADKKFKVIVDSLNKNLLDNYGKIRKIDKRAFNLYYDGGNKIIQFMYSTGNLNITYRQNSLGNEIVCERLFNNLRSASDEKQTLIAEEFLLYVERKIYALKVINNSKAFREKKPLNTTKFELNSMFYDFCFNVETSKVFLEKNPFREYLVHGMELADFEGEYLVETIFHRFLKKKYKIVLHSTEYNEYVIDSYKFKINVVRKLINDKSSYFEILQNNFKDVENQYGEEALIAEKFILFCIDHTPVYIFVLIKDPYTGSYAIRRVLENGQSSKIAFIDDVGTLFDTLANYIENTGINF